MFIMAITDGLIMNEHLYLESDCLNESVWMNHSVINQIDLVLELNLAWLNDPVAAVDENISE